MYLQELHKNHVCIVRSQVKMGNNHILSRNRRWHWQLHLPLQSVHPVKIIPGSWTLNKPWSAMRPTCQWLIMKLPIIMPVNSLSFRTTALQLNYIFSIKGVAKNLHQWWAPLQQWRVHNIYSSMEFKHTICSPLYPKSNRCIECYV